MATEEELQAARDKANAGRWVMGTRNRNVVRSRPVKCGTCNGTGTVPVDPNDRRKGEQTCGKCGGTGEM